jgi:ATP-dependent RNA helicase DDX23/PRP28
MGKLKEKSSRSERERERDRKDRKRSRSRSREERKSEKLAKEEKVKIEIKDDENEKLQATKKKEPLSLEELLAKKKAEEELKSKPVFISKEQRALDAIKRRQEQVAAMKAATQVPKFGDVPVTELLKKEREKDQPRSYDRRDRDRDRYDDRRERERPGSSRNDKDNEKVVLEEGGSTKDKEKESEAIRERYLGIIKKKRRVRRLNDRKFVFDWDANEDTSNDYNLLYKDRHYVQFFGRGNVAGIDIKDQKRKQSKFYGDLLEKRRTDAEKEQEKVRLKKVKKKEERERWGDRHWTEKEIAEMTERDWRIFREDYNITIKGGKIPNPIRKWHEASFQKEILDIIDKVGYKEPTPIQRQAIPIGLQNRDIIGKNHVKFNLQNTNYIVIYRYR